MIFRLDARTTAAALVLVLFLVLGASAVSGARGNRDPGDLVARAEVEGGPLAPQLRATVEFRRGPNGTLVLVRARGLPPYQPGMPPIGPHGFHIHEGGSCEVGDPERPFQAAGGHWNPDEQPHGNHAGDFPVLFSYGGRAWLSFFTDRFAPEQPIGRTVIIHRHPDDYRTQPDGAAGPRLACGVITAVGRPQPPEP